MEYYTAIKKCIYISSNEVDETGAYPTERRKSERKTPIQYIMMEFRKMVTMTLLFLRLHPSTAFQTVLLTMMATPFLLRDSCPQ